jgi:hypothetical protein
MNLETPKKPQKGLITSNENYKVQFPSISESCKLTLKKYVFSVKKKKKIRFLGYTNTILCFSKLASLVVRHGLF